MSRTLSHEVQLRATPEAVWRALSDAEELRRWFPVDARVEPGEGGKIWLSWGPGSEAETRIEIWEPGRRLRVVAAGVPEPFATDYHIDAKGGGTVLRVVTSGFGEGADWDAMYDGMDRGWQYFLLNLRVYLERHPGVPRDLAWQRRPMRSDRAAAWRALMTGLSLGDAPRLGDQVRVVVGGQDVAGSVALLVQGEVLAAELPSLDDGLLFFEFEGGGDAWTLGAYLSTYGLPPERTARLKAGFAEWLDRLLP